MGRNLRHLNPGMPAVEAPGRRHRLLQYSLRSMLFLMLLMSIVMGRLTVKLQRRRGVKRRQWNALRPWVGLSRKTFGFKGLPFPRAGQINALRHGLRGSWGRISFRPFDSSGFPS